jgi:ubiquinone/menaquinone biosynthesis C-methylase UbiE
MDRTKIAVAVFDKNAAKYTERFMNVDAYAEALDLFCDTLNNEQAAILDVASGPGNIIQYLLRNHPAYQILGTDLSPAMLAIAQEQNPTAKFQMLDAKSIKTLGQTFNGISCGFCLPYLSEVETTKFISDCAELLSPGGALYISTMEEDDEHHSGIERSSSGDEVYVYYHRAVFITDTLQQAGFDVIQLSRHSYDYNGKMITDVMVVAQKL